MILYDGISSVAKKDFIFLGKGDGASNGYQLHDFGRNEENCKDSGYFQFGKDHSNLYFRVKEPILKFMGGYNERNTIFNV